MRLSEEHDIRDNMLILRNVQKDDQGVYNCVGIDRYGIEVFSRPIMLIVVGEFVLPILLRLFMYSFALRYLIIYVCINY